jgi:hypothetical protein
MRDRKRGWGSYRSWRRGSSSRGRGLPGWRGILSRKVHAYMHTYYSVMFVVLYLS